MIADPARPAPFCLLLLVAAMLLLASCAGAPASGPTARPDPAPQQGPTIIKPAALPPLAPPADTTPSIGSGDVRVALLVPLSGRHAGLGDALLNAAQLALFDTNILRLTLLPIDTEGTPEGATRAMLQAMNQRAHLVLGPVFSDSIRALGPVARRNGIPVIGFSTDRSVAGNGIYVMGFTPEQQITRIVDHARSLGKERFAALIPRSLYGDRMLAAYTQAITKRNAEMIQVEFYEEDETTLTEPVKRLANYDVRRTALLEEVQAMEAFGEDDDLAGEILATLENVETLGELDFDAVLLPAGGNMIRSLAPLLPYYEIDPALVQFLGTGQWDDPGLRLEPALHGARFAGPAPEAAAGFAQRYQAMYDQTSPRIASLAYDATALVATLLQLNNYQPFSRQALMNSRGFSGIDGVFRFQQDGTAERRLTVIEISPKGLQVVEDATSTVMPAVLSPTYYVEPTPADRIEQNPDIDPSIVIETDDGLEEGVFQEFGPFDDFGIIEGPIDGPDGDIMPESPPSAY